MVDEYKEHLQSIFDEVITKLLLQGKPSKFTSSCAYRSSDGVSRCAVGHLIQDKLYDPAFENRSFMVLVEDYGTDMLPNVFKEEFSDNVDELIVFLQDMQNMHDSISNLPNDHFNEKLLQKAEIFANNNNLRFEYENCDWY